MSKISPRPVIAQVLKTWHIPPGMTYALVEDIERRIWIVESCPAGTHAWTLKQASDLARGPKTGPALREALRMGCDLQKQIARSSLPREEYAFVRPSLIHAVSQ